MNLNVCNETSTLKAVVLGQPGSIGSTPNLDKTYDAKSYESVLNGNFPTEEAIYKEMTAFEKVLLKYDVQVFRPWTLENCNQVFARDVGFVIDDKIINSNIIPDREDEKEAYEVIYDQIAYNKIYNLPEKAHVEGGDVVLYNDIVFVGLYSGADYPQFKTARTNLYAFNYLKELFPDTRFDIGPSTDDGFYYDFDMEHRLIPEDLEKLESVMKRISGEKLPFKKMEISRSEAESLLKNQNQKYKLERLSDIPEGETITFYQCGDFVDLCRGPHVEHSGQVGAMKLLRRWFFVESFWIIGNVFSRKQFIGYINTAW